MANRVSEQIAAYGAAQVMVILKDLPPLAAAAAKASAGLAASVPVSVSRAIAGVAEAVVMDEN